MILGDFNASVGSDKTDREKIMGQHGPLGIGTITGNESRLCDVGRIILCLVGQLSNTREYTS